MGSLNGHLPPCSSVHLLYYQEAQQGGLNALSTYKRGDALIGRIPSFVIIPKVTFLHYPKPDVLQKEEL